MDDTAAGGRTARLLAVLAILLGLLAMHGVASAHHAAGTPAASQEALPAADRAPTGADGPDHHQSAAATMPQADGVGLAAPAGPTCGDDCADVAVLCLAVLTGVALALLLTSRPTSPLPARPIRHTAVRPSAPAFSCARGPDPVRELCVNRT